jgi:hypothetical protein
MKLFPVMPVIFIAAYVFVAASIAISTPQYAIIGIGSITLFMLIYFFTRGIKNKQIKMDLSCILNELGEERENYFNAISPPIAQTSNFAFKTVADLSKAFEDEMGGYLYSRGLNPTVEILRKKLAALDGAEDCLVLIAGLPLFLPACLLM